MMRESRDGEERHRRKVDALFGEIALKLGVITRAQLEEALLLQRCAREHRPLGLLLADLKVITAGDLERILEAQKALAIAAEERARAVHDDNLFGKVAIRLKLCAEKHLQEAIAAQDQLPKDKFMRLGDLMVSRGVLTADQVNLVLQMQKQLVMTCPKCGTKYNTVMFNPGISLPCYTCGTVLQVPQRAALPAMDAALSPGTSP